MYLLANKGELLASTFHRYCPSDKWYKSMLLMQLTLVTQEQRSQALKCREVETKNNNIMELFEKMVEDARSNQFKINAREPEMVRLIENNGDVVIRHTIVTSNNRSKDAILVMPKDIVYFKEFKQWANTQNIPTYCTQCDEYQRDCGIVLWDGMPLCNTQSWSSMVIHMDVEIEASGEDIMSIMLRYYSI